MMQTFLFAPTADAAFLDPQQCNTIANTVLSDCCPMLAVCDKHFCLLHDTKQKPTFA